MQFRRTTHSWNKSWRDHGYMNAWSNQKVNTPEGLLTMLPAWYNQTFSSGCNIEKNNIAKNLKSMEASYILCIKNLKATSKCDTRVRIPSYYEQEEQRGCNLLCLH